MSGPTPSTPESVRQAVAAAIRQASESDSDAQTDNDDIQAEEDADTESGSETEVAGDANAGAGNILAEQMALAAPGRRSSSVFDESTVFVGPFALVLRETAGAQSFYVTCPLHTYKGSDGGVHRCGKSMQLNQPDRTTVIQRLRWWIWSGALALRLALFGVLHQAVARVLCRTALIVQREGTMMVRAPNETAEEFRRRHVQMEA